MEKLDVGASFNNLQNLQTNHGKIYPIDAEEHLPIHVNGKCEMVPMRTKAAGTATDMGKDGVDAYLLEHGKLPEYYVTK